MNRMTDIPQYPGDELEKIMDYRYRAFLLGGIQMLFANGYVLYLRSSFDGRLWLQASWYLHLYNLFISTTNGDATTTRKDDLLVDAQMPQPTFWDNSLAIIASLHVLSSIYLIIATKHIISKHLAIEFCEYVQQLNCAFFIFDIVMFVLSQQEWYVTLVLTLYRFIFTYTVNECLKTIQSLAPPPPGRSDKGFWRFSLNQH